MLSVVILTKNEERNIEECLKSVEWADEIVVIDDFSEDGTLEKIRSMKQDPSRLGNRSEADAGGEKIQIFQRKLDGDFAEQRNFGLEKAKGEWVLFVDADERVIPDLASEIRNVISKSKKTGYYLRRQDNIWGRLIIFGETSDVRLLRLGKKDAGVWEGKVHEVWKIKGKIGELDNSLNHFPHPTITEFLEEINFYSTLRARELYDNGRKTNLGEIIFYPLAKFFQDYFLRLGFFDGMPGFAISLFMSFHSFLVRSKLYLLWKER